MNKIVLLMLIFCLAGLLWANSVTIVSFGEDSSMQKIGSEAGDVIAKYDGMTITSIAELTTARDNAKADKIEVVIIRNGKEMNFTIPKGKLGVMLKEFAPDHEVLGDAVILDGYGKLDWNNETSNTFLACLALMEDKFGGKTKYSDLVGLSGYGFRVQVYPGFCPSAPDATSGMNVGDYVLQILGYSTEPMFVHVEDPKVDAADPEQIPALRKLIKSTIDGGYPLIAIDMIEIPEWGLITGYQNNGTEYWCRTFFDKTNGYEIAQKEPWAVWGITGYKAEDLTKAYGNSLKLARQMYQTKEYDGYRSGLEAYRYWIEMLGDEKSLSNLTDDELGEASHGNWWTYMSLMEARYHCYTYLTENKERFGVDETQVDALAKVYDEEVQLLSKNLKEIPAQFDNPPRQWVKVDRKKQIEVLKAMQKLEEKAVGILKNMY